MSILFTVLNFNHNIQVLRKVINNTCRCSDINSHYANMHRCKDDAVRGFINGYVKLLVDKDQYLYDRRDKYYNAGCEMMDVRFEVFENNYEEFQIGVAYGARSGYETIDCIFTPPKHIDMLKEFILDNHSCCDRMDDNEITRWVNIASEHRTLPALKFNCIYDNWQKLREYFQKMCQAGEPDAEQWGQRALACAEKIKGEWDREWATVNSLLDLSKYYLNKMLLSEAEPLIVRVLNISDYDEFRPIYPELYEEIWFAAGLYNLKHEKYLEAEPYFDEVLYFRKRRLGPRDFSLVEVFESLAEVYAKTDRNDAANESLNSAASISPHKYNKINTSLIEAYTKASHYNGIPHFCYVINQALRSTDINDIHDDIKKAIIELDGAFIQKSDKCIVLYRATTMSNLNAFTSGVISRYPAFMAASRSLPSVIEFMNRIPGDDLKVLLKIVYPAGQPLIDTVFINNAQEVILPRNCMFRIDEWFPEDDEEIIIDISSDKTPILKYMYMREE